MCRPVLPLKIIQTALFWGGKMVPMLCGRCGQELPESAQFCLKCGASVEPVPAVSAAEGVARSEVASAQPYRWGKFQGWCLAAGMPLLALGVLATASTPEDQNVGIGALVMCALAVPMGVGILKKKRYGLILVYVSLGLICLSILVSFAKGGAEGALSAATGASIWVYSTIYYHKRRGEFT
jgi:hypothetical protein